MFLLCDEAPPEIAPLLLCLGHAASIGDWTTSAKWCSCDAYVYRVFGSAAPFNGHSWTPVNPLEIGRDAYRDAAGLPDSNTGDWLIKGTLRRVAGITKKTADRIGNRPGGLCEYLIEGNVADALDFGERIPLVPPF